MGAVSMLATAVSGAMQANAENEAGKDNQAIAEWNASVAIMQSADALERGRTAEGRQRVQTRQLQGAQRAALAAQGIEINDATDSAGQIQLDTQRQGELDALTIRNNAFREAWGFQVEAQNQTQQGELARKRGLSQARGTLITTGANLVNQTVGFAKMGFI